MINSEMMKGGGRHHSLLTIIKKTERRFLTGTAKPVLLGESI